MRPEHVGGLREALRRGGDTHTLGDVVRLIDSGDAQLWEEGDAVIVTEVHQTPRKRLIHFWLATGDLASVVALSHRILGWARAEGYDGATLTGRRGWERALRDDGWELTMTMMSRGV